jgi:hypothetical protein
MGDYDDETKIREAIAAERRRKVRQAVSGASGGGSSVLNRADYSYPDDDNDNDDESLPQDEEDNEPTKPPRETANRPSNVKKGSNIQLTEDLPGRSIIEKLFFCVQTLLIMFLY